MTTTLASIQTALGQRFEPTIARQFNSRAPLLAWLARNGRVQLGSGKNVGWDAQFSGAAAETYADGADVASYTKNIEEPAILPWALQRHNFKVTGLAAAAAASNGGIQASALEDIFGTRMDDGAMALAKRMNGQLYTGTGGTDIVGLGTAISVTGPYAGISRVTYSQWQGVEQGNGNVDRALTLILIDALERAIYTANGEPVDAIFTTPLLAEKIGTLNVTGIQRVIPANEMSPYDGRSLANKNVMTRVNVAAGYAGFDYKGIPVYRDIDCPAEFLYALNSNSMAIKVLPAGTDPAAVQARMKTLIDAGEFSNALAAACVVEPLGKTGDASNFTMKMYMQLQVREPNKNGKLFDLIP